MAEINNITEKELSMKLDLTFNKNQIYDLWYNLVKNFLLTNLNIIWNGVSGTDIMGGLNLKGNLNKNDLVGFCARFYSNTSALADFVQSLSGNHKKLIEKAAWATSLGVKDLEEIFGRPVIWVNETLTNNYYSKRFDLVKDPVLKSWERYITKDGYWSSYHQSAKEFLAAENPQLSFPPLLRLVFGQILPKPEGYYLVPLEEPENTTFFNAEETIFRDIPLITAYYLQGNITYSQKGYPNAAAGRKMAKKLPIEPFPHDGEESLRNHIIAGLFSDNFKLADISQSPIQILQQLFKRNFVKAPLAPFLLKHLKGINYFNYSDYNNTLTLSIFAIIKQMPLEAWVSFKNIKQFVEAHFINLELLSKWHIERLTTDFGIVNGYETRINRYNSREYVDIPHLAGHIYLLAAFGLMEIGVDEKAELIYSNYDALHSCRLTKLGAYIFGLQKDYTPPERESETKLTFDENSTIIRVEGNIALADTMMGNYTVKVSENRYQFSPEKFLKDCKTTKNLENKIELFKQTINQKLPAFWENYLKQLVINSLLIKQKNNLRVFNLPADNKELHRIIAQDNELRGIIIKAEKFHILVSELHVNAFVNRMKALGYLIN